MNKNEARQVTHLSLFSGIEGLDLAAEWAGFRTVGQCEFADYPHAVLMKHWPDVPKWRDIHDLTAADFTARTGRRSVTVVSGGFPCQPFSVAGHRKGTDDSRYLWPEMLRVIREIKPLWVVAENVPGIIRIAGETVCSDLEREGYAVRAYVYEAASVGAPHRRERVAFVAHTNSWGSPLRRNGKFSADAEISAIRNSDGRRTQKPDAGQRWELESRPYGVADGVPNRVDRLKCLGNAVVPQQFYPIFKAIAELEANVDGN